MAWIQRLACSLAALAAFALGGQAAATELRVIGGLAGVNQYVHLEEPFWRDDLPRLSKGRLSAKISPFDRSGLKAQEMLQLMKMGIVEFGTAILSVVDSEDPELAAIDLSGLNPDMASLKRSVAAFRPALEARLRERYNVQLLAVYAYPAQVLFCTGTFSGLNDLAGRKVRTSSVSQSDMFAALGAIPTVVPFAQMPDAVRRKVVDCAVTGTLSGNEVGLADVSTHLHGLPINWGVSIFGVNAAAWKALDEKDRVLIADAVQALETRIWQSAERDTMTGLYCNTGDARCSGVSAKSLALVPASKEDGKVVRKVFVESVLPRWAARCGSSCAKTWNGTLPAATGIRFDERGIPAAADPSN
ncbi:TRAP transporter substrate-binding protein [uncultured Alsobacter sp.]|uniref:TRAP transporter substrate-binding protein n=1 Tax=uncultured Alsobacter sp. TaxID=1748258 RepID=UPI0025E88089|nr:TRAP transporter substrate-binding protein [uncultured Alsobacter sp.]